MSVTKEQHNMASTKDRQTAEEPYKNSRDTEAVQVNLSRAMQTPQRIPLGTLQSLSEISLYSLFFMLLTLVIMSSAKPGRVVGPVAPFENGNVMRDAYDPRTLIRSSVVHSQAVPPNYCYRKPTIGNQERSGAEAEREMSLHQAKQQQAAQCGMAAAKLAPDVAINIDTNPFFMTRVGISNKVEHEDRIVIDTNLLQAKATYGGIGPGAAAPHRKVGTVQFGMTRMY